LKKQVHLGWEYSGSPQDLTRETQENITPELLAKHLGEIFQDTSSWPTTVASVGHLIIVKEFQIELKIEI
jgi:hypothetical protein